MESSNKTSIEKFKVLNINSQVILLLLQSALLKEITKMSMLAMSVRMLSARSFRSRQDRELPQKSF
jgi:hypothetical protein